MARTITKLKHTLHKPTGQTRVRIAGRDFYLGPYGSENCRERYDELIGDWLARQDTTCVTLTVDDLALLYLAHADEHVRKNGKSTSEVSGIRAALRRLVATAGTNRIRSFGPRRLAEVRQRMIDAGLARTTINQHVGRKADTSAYLFSPADAREEFEQQRKANRKTPIPPHIANPSCDFIAAAGHTGHIVSGVAPSQQANRLTDTACSPKIVVFRCDKVAITLRVMSAEGMR